MKKLPTYDSSQQIISKDSDEYIKQIINRTNRILCDSKQNRKKVEEIINNYLKINTY